MTPESAQTFLSYLEKDDQGYLVAEYFRTTPLAVMAVPLRALKETETAWRLAHKGFAPPEVFELLLGPVTVSVQIVHEVQDVDGKRLGYALRLRDEGEVGDAYCGLFHNTCCSFRWLDTLESAAERDDRDAFGGTHSVPLEMLGETLHFEAPRRNMDQTTMYRRVIWMKDIERMKGTWKFFTDEEICGLDPRIIPSNWHQLMWAMNPFREKFGVLRETFPKELLGN